MASSPWDGRRVPFTLLGGYLGAGKTTIVNRVLAGARGRRLVVLVNDVGAINVDAGLIADHDGHTLTMTNGCVCCSIADDFGQTLEQVRSLADAPDHLVPDHIMMELSGVGEPARIAPWANTAGFRLDGIVVAADADQIIEMAQRRFVGDTIREQLRTADLVLVTKTDVAVDRGDAARQFLTTLTTAPLIDTADLAANMVADVVLGIGGSTGGGASATGEQPTAIDHHHAGLIDVSGLTRSALEQVVSCLGPEVIRAKGVIRCVDSPDLLEVQVIGSRRSVRARPDLVATGPVDRIVTISALTRS
jgi:G3E family GTPase